MRPQKQTEFVWVMISAQSNASLTASGGCRGQLDPHSLSINRAWAHLPLNYSAVWLYPNTVVTRNLSQFKQFDIHVYSSPRTTNLQQNCTKQTLAPHFSGESLNFSDYCFIFTFLYIYIVYCERVSCWWKPHFPLGESTNPRSLDPGHPSACVRARALPNWSETAASISDWRQRARGGETGEWRKRSVRFYFYLSLVVSQLEWRQRSKKRIVLKRVYTQIIS